MVSGEPTVIKLTEGLGWTAGGVKGRRLTDGPKPTKKSLPNTAVTVICTTVVKRFRFKFFLWVY